MTKRKQVKPLKAKLEPDHPFYSIIEDAYQVFCYDTPSSTEVCVGCCMDREIEADFFSPPIRDLPLHYLQDWYFAAYDPSGVSKRTWGYLLPRVLEVLAAGDDPAMVGLEVSLNRFQTGVRENWSDAEWAVLNRFQRAYLERSMSQGEDYLDDILCMFGLAGWPLQELFDQVSAFPDELLVRRFHRDWCLGRPTIWITAFWERSGNTAAFEFYTSRRMYERFEMLAFDPETNPDLAEKAMQVASVIVDFASWTQTSD